MLKVGDDILAQFFYLLDHEVPHVAERFINAVDRTFSQLTEYPQIGAPRKLRNRHLEGLRQWPVEGFERVQIYYLLTEDAIRVVRILHGKRDRDQIPI